MRNSLLLASLVLVWVLPGLFPHEPWKADEAYSFGIVYHMLETGDWVVPAVAGEPFMEKPPLFYITAAGFARLFSPLLKLHDGARLASGFYVLIAFLFAGLSGRRLWGAGRGTTTVALVMGSAGLLLNVHLLVTDTALLAGCAIAMFGLTQAQERPVAGGVWLGLGTGIGFLSKGLVAPGMFGLASLLLPVLSPPLRTRRYALFLAIALLAALPSLTVWPFALYRRSPDLFREWLWNNNFGRFFGFSHLGPRNTGTYLVLLSYFALPTYLIALWATWRKVRGGGLRETAFAVPLAVFLAMWGTLEASSEGRDLYAVPMLLPVSLMAASVVPALSRRTSAVLNGLGAAVFTGGISALWMMWSALTTGHPPGLAGWLNRISPAYVPAFRPFPFALAVVFTAWWLALAASELGRQHGERAVSNWAAGTSLCWGVAMAILLPWLDAGNSYRPVMVSLAVAVPPGHEIALSSLGESERAMLHYYTGIETHRVVPGGPNEFDVLLLQTRPGAKDGMGEGWRKIWEGSRQGDGKECFRLYHRVDEPVRKVLSSSARKLRLKSKG